LNTITNLKINRFKYWAAFIYAIAVLPIQLSHFFAVDTFLNTFALMSVYFMLRVLFMHRDKVEEPWRVYLFTALSANSWDWRFRAKSPPFYFAAYGRSDDCDRTQKL